MVCLDPPKIEVSKFHSEIDVSTESVYVENQDKVAIFKCNSSGGNPSAPNKTFHEFGWCYFKQENWNDILPSEDKNVNISACELPNENINLWHNSTQSPNSMIIEFMNVKREIAGWLRCYLKMHILNNIINSNWHRIRVHRMYSITFPHK